MIGDDGIPQQPTSPGESRDLESLSTNSNIPEPKTKSYFVDIRDLDPTSVLKDLTPEQKEIALAALHPSAIKTGMLASIPMGCTAERCPAAWKCPLQLAGIAPRGKACPVEAQMIQVFFNSYCEELGVDKTRMVEVGLVRDVVDQDVQMMRKSNLMALEDFIVKNVVGVDIKGNPLYRQELHPMVQFEDRIHKRKSELLKMLLATREAKAKHTSNNADPEVSEMVSAWRKEKKRIANSKLIEIQPIDNDEQ